jgi:ABC-type multidrug transport system permease subunit
MSQSAPAADRRPLETLVRGTWANRALVQLTLVRVREFVREPEALFWTLLFPVLLAAGLGIAFRNRPTEVLTIAAVTSSLADALRAEPSLDVQQLSAADADLALRRGRVALVVDSEQPGTVVYRYDDTNPEGRMARLLANGAIQRAGGRADPVDAADHAVRESGSRYIDFLIPGLVGVGIMGNSVWTLGFAIVDARRRKLMKRIMATPMRRHDYLLSFLCFRLLMVWVEVGVPIAFGAVAFAVPRRGSILVLAGLCVLGSLAFSAIGLLVASRVRTIEAVSGLANLVMVPMWVLSGVFFSAQRFPNAVQPLIKALPLTALIDALRANMLQGAGFVQIEREVATLGAWLAVAFVVALKVFRWR